MSEEIKKLPLREVLLGWAKENDASADDVMNTARDRWEEGMKVVDQLRKRAETQRALAVQLEGKLTPDTELYMEQLLRSPSAAFRGY